MVFEGLGVAILVGVLVTNSVAVGSANKDSFVGETSGPTVGGFSIGSTIQPAVMSSIAAPTPSPTPSLSACLRSNLGLPSCVFMPNDILP